MRNFTIHYFRANFSVFFSSFSILYSKCNMNASCGHLIRMEKFRRVALRNQEHALRTTLLQASMPWSSRPWLGSWVGVSGRALAKVTALQSAPNKTCIYSCSFLCNGCLIWYTSSYLVRQFPSSPRNIERKPFSYQDNLCIPPTGSSGPTHPHHHPWVASCYWTRWLYRPPWLVSGQIFSSVKPN